MGNSSLGCSVEDKEVEDEPSKSTMLATCSEQVLPALEVGSARLRDGRLGDCCVEDSEREFYVRFPSSFAEDEVSATFWNGIQGKTPPDTNLTSHSAICDNVAISLYDGKENDPNSEDGEHIMEEVTYELVEPITCVQHHSEKDTEDSTVETWASMNFNKRKAAVQVMKGWVQQEGCTESASISTQASQSDNMQLGELLATSTVIHAISPPPHAPTTVGAPVCFDKNVSAQAH